MLIVIQTSSTIIEAGWLASSVSCIGGHCIFGPAETRHSDSLAEFIKRKRKYSGEGLRSGLVILLGRFLRVPT